MVWVDRLLEIGVNRLLVVVILLLRRVVVRNSLNDGRRLAILLVLEDRLANLQSWERFPLNNRRQGLETSVLD